MTATTTCCDDFQASAPLPAPLPRRHGRRRCRRCRPPASSVTQSARPRSPPPPAATSCRDQLPGRHRRARHGRAPRRPRLLQGPPRHRVSADRLVAKDAMFGLHPKMQPLEWLWDSGEFAAVQAVGMAQPNRSHFAAMEAVEDADPGSSLRQGWVNRMVGLDADSAGARGRAPRRRHASDPDRGHRPERRHQGAARPRARGLEERLGGAPACAARHHLGARRGAARQRRSLRAGDGRRARPAGREGLQDRGPLPDELARDGPVGGAEGHCSADQGRHRHRGRLDRLRQLGHARRLRHPRERRHDADDRRLRRVRLRVHGGPRAAAVQGHPRDDQRVRPPRAGERQPRPRPRLGQHDARHGRWRPWRPVLRQVARPRRGLPGRRRPQGRDRLPRRSSARSCTSASRRRTSARCSRASARTRSASSPPPDRRGQRICVVLPRISACGSRSPRTCAVLCVEDRPPGRLSGAIVRVGRESHPCGRLSAFRSWRQRYDVRRTARSVGCGTVGWSSSAHPVVCTSQQRTIRNRPTGRPRPDAPAAARRRPATSAGRAQRAWARETSPGPASSSIDRPTQTTTSAMPNRTAAVSRGSVPVTSAACQAGEENRAALPSTQTGERADHLRRLQPDRCHPAGDDADRADLRGPGQLTVGQHRHPPEGRLHHPAYGGAQLGAQTTTGRDVAVLRLGHQPGELA